MVKRIQNVAGKEGGSGDVSLGIAFRECELSRRNWLESPRGEGRGQQPQEGLVFRAQGQACRKGQVTREKSRPWGQGGRPAQSQPVHSDTPAHTHHALRATHTPRPACNTHTHVTLTPKP